MFFCFGVIILAFVAISVLRKDTLYMVLYWVTLLKEPNSTCIYMYWY